jgi:peptide chain release factor subunit 1
LALFCGLVEPEDSSTGGGKKISIDFQPWKPIPTTVYLCDSQFHTEIFHEMLDCSSDDSYGFIIMDGNGCLFATVQGSHRTVLFKFSVDLPKKHGRGGQSALRFARLRLEKRHNYLRRCAELAIQYFIRLDTQQVNVKGIILAGSADFKNNLFSSDLFDPRLKQSVVTILDIAYGMEAGFNQALEMSSDILKNVKLMHEKSLLQNYYSEIAQDTGKYCFMMEDTVQALEMNAVESLFLWESLDVYRWILWDPMKGEEKCLFLSSEQEKNENYFHDPTTGVPYEVRERVLFIEWIVSNYKSFGVKNIHLVTDRSPEGSQFCKGFGGIGGLLRWRVDFLAMKTELLVGDDDDDDGGQEDEDGDNGFAK